MELMATTLQTSIKNTSMKDGECPHNEVEEDEGNKEANDNKKEEDEEKDPLKTSLEQINCSF